MRRSRAVRAARPARRRSRGQSIVEFSLLLPLMFVLFAGAADFSRIYFAGSEIPDASREAALYASHHGVGKVGSLTCNNCSGTASTCTSYCTNSTLPSCTDWCSGGANTACTTYCYGNGNSVCGTFCYGNNNTVCTQYCSGQNNPDCASYCTGPNEPACTAICSWDGVTTPASQILAGVAAASGNSPFRCPAYTVSVQTPVPGPAGTSEQAVTLTCNMPMLTNFLPVGGAIVVRATSTALLPVAGT